MYFFKIRPKVMRPKLIHKIDYAVSLLEMAPKPPELHVVQARWLSISNHPN
jgi:hypothetical protein